ENIIVVIKTNNGITGFGECSPFMTINGESMETCFIIGQYIAKVLKGKNPLDIAACSALMDSLIYGNSSIKSAFDIAIYDIASQNDGMPLYKFLGGNNDKILVTDYTVSIGDPEKMANDALKIKQAGFPVIKVKLGETKEKDVERIQKIRNAVGKEIPLRIDANQGWDVETAIATLNVLSAYNIQFCEEPIPRWNFMELPKIKKRSPVLIMADESCCDHHDAKRLIDLKACDMFNIKLGKSAGFFKAIKIIKLAETAGIKMQVGGFLESRLGFTAAAHLALSGKNILYCDFDTPLMLTEDCVTDGISYEPNGVVKLAGKPGLGAAIDIKYLRSLQKKAVF
ncbi:MAG TPA: dipeptide epimerase, partial [Bacteroidia bacterium]|nr:dipeptide epimerase [Bacteroidia bacterium]